jgi:hypothetical protein
MTDAIAAVVGKHGHRLDEAGRRVFAILLRSIGPGISEYATAISGEKARKRKVEKVRSDASRLLAAIKLLDDEDAFEFVGYALLDGDLTLPLGAARRKVELRSRRGMKDLMEALRRVSDMRSDDLPPQVIKFRPELLIACDVVKALNQVGLPTTASDTGVAADCFRAVAVAAGIGNTNAKYWLREAKKHPEI